MKKVLIALVIILAIILGYAGVAYNRFVSAAETIDTQWAQVESQLQRRFDLIPNLVSSVQGLMKQEGAIFTAIADARTRYAGAVTPSDKAAAAGEVESAFGRLLAVIENYPQLKSSEAVQTLMSQLEGTENRISVERMRYNDSVRSYNVSVKRIPSSIIASLFGFGERTYFEAAEEAATAPSVSL